MVEEEPLGQEKLSCQFRHFDEYQRAGYSYDTMRHKNCKISWVEGEKLTELESVLESELDAGLQDFQVFDKVLQVQHRFEG
jgi:hypothetical protein